MDATVKLAVWPFQLSEFNIEVFHRVVLKHQAANALSHFPTIVMSESTLGENILEITRPKRSQEYRRTKRQKLAIVSLIKKAWNL